jgi:type VI secretion system secreted protein Hcp
MRGRLPGLSGPDTGNNIMDTILLAIPKIKGDSQLDSPLGAGAIEIHSFSHGVAMHLIMDVSNQKRVSGKADFQSMSLTKSTDQATPALYAACAAGDSLGDVELAIGRTEGGKFVPEMSYKLKDAMVEVISTSGGAGGPPHDQFALAYVQIETTFTQQKTDAQKGGKAQFGWHRATNTATQ